MAQINRALVTRNTDGRARGPGHQVRTKPQCFDHSNHTGDLGIAGTGVHNYQHCRKGTAYLGG